MRSKPLVLNSKWLVAGRIWGRCGTGIDQSRMFFDQLLLFLSQWLRCCLLRSCASFLTDCFIIPRRVCRPNQQKPKYANSSDFYWFSNGFKPFQKQSGPCACFFTVCFFFCVSNCAFCVDGLNFCFYRLRIFFWRVALLYFDPANDRDNRHTAGKQCGH